MWEWPIYTVVNNSTVSALALSCLLRMFLSVPFIARNIERRRSGHIQFPIITFSNCERTLKFMDRLLMDERQRQRQGDEERERERADRNRRKNRRNTHAYTKEEAHKQWYEPLQHSTNKVLNAGTKSIKLSGKRGMEKDAHAHAHAHTVNSFASHALFIQCRIRSETLSACALAHIKLHLFSACFWEPLFRSPSLSLSFSCRRPFRSLRSHIFINWKSLNSLLFEFARIAGNAVRLVCRMCGSKCPNALRLNDFH